MEDELIQFPHLQKALEECIIELRNAYQDNLIDSDRIASGGLLNSVEIVTTFGNQYFAVGLKLADYWKYVEYDTKPHFPPPSAILDWIKVKPILPTPDKNGKLPTPEQLAFLIGRKIAKVGTKGSHDLKKAEDQLRDMVEEKIEKALDEDVNVWIGMATLTFFQK